ncbi:MAG: hypothetical protein JRH20_08070, partial [Deltaproteobacteria bacterium]|nr:hypothetical protein [Deltaproteobacteria bacterium]
SLAGQHTSVPLRSDLPRVIDQGFPRVRLPDGSALFYVHRSLAGTSVLLRVDPSGSLDILAEAPGLYANTLGRHLAFDSTATYAALVSDAGATLLWVRVDGAMFPGGEHALSIELPADVTAIHDASMRVVGNQLFAVAELESGEFALLRAAVSSTVQPAAALSIGGVSSLPSMEDDLMVDRAGTTVLLRASFLASGEQDLYGVDVASGVATRLTATPKALFPVEGAQRRRAISRTHVAYLVQGSATPQLYVALAQQDAEPVLVSGPRFFDVDAIWAIERLVFEADDVLLFWAGFGSQQVDLYRYDASAASLENLTSPTMLAPFTGEGNLRVRALFEDAAGAGFYFVGESYFDGFRNLFHYPFGGPGRQLSAGIRLSDRARDFAHCAADGALWVSALSDISRPQFDVFAGSLTNDVPLMRSTSLAGAGPWSVADLQLQGDCATLLFSAGPYYGSQRLWALDTSSRRVWPITPVPRVLAPGPLITPDGSTVVYASGGGPATMTLKAARVIGGGESTLDSTAGEVEPLAVYP